MNNYVIDASVVFKWFVLENEENFEQAREIFQKLKNGELVLFAPNFLPLEIINVLYWKQKFLNDDVNTVLDKLATSGINFTDCPARNTKDIFTLMTDFKLTAYDALYLWLAKDRGLKLISVDQKLLAVKDYVISPQEVVI